VPKVVEDYRGKYERVSALLDELPALLELVHRDVRRLSRGSGRARRLLSQPGEPGPLLVAARPVKRLDQRFAWGERIPLATARRTPIPVPQRGAQRLCCRPSRAGAAYRAAPREVPDPVSVAQLWQRVAAWAPVLTAGYVCHQLAHVPGMTAFGALVGALSADGSPGTTIALRFLLLLQTSVLAAGLAFTVATLWKLGQSRDGGRSTNWLQAQALRVAGPVAYWAALLALLLLPGQGTTHTREG